MQNSCHYWSFGFIVTLAFFIAVKYFYSQESSAALDMAVDVSYGSAESTEEVADTTADVGNKMIAKYRRKWAGNGINIDDVEFQKKTELWKEKLLRKLICLRMKKASIYMYHIRRAAGSTVREVLHQVALRWGARYHETEGPVLNADFLALPGLLTITTLRFSSYALIKIFI